MPIAFQIIAGICIALAIWLAWGADTYNAMELNVKRSAVWVAIAFVVLVAGHWW